MEIHTKVFISLLQKINNSSLGGEENKPEKMHSQEDTLDVILNFCI